VRKKRFSVEQIVSVLNEAEVGTPVVDLIRKVGFWSRRFAAGRRSTAGLSRAKQGS